VYRCDVARKYAPKTAKFLPETVAALERLAAADASGKTTAGGLIREAVQLLLEARTRELRKLGMPPGEIKVACGG